MYRFRSVRLPWEAINAISSARPHPHPCQREDTKTQTGSIYTTTLHEVYMKIDHVSSILHSGMCMPIKSIVNVMYYLANAVDTTKAKHRSGGGYTQQFEWYRAHCQLAQQVRRIHRITPQITHSFTTLVRIWRLYQWVIDQTAWLYALPETCGIGARQQSKYSQHRFAMHVWLTMTGFLNRYVLENIQIMSDFVASIFYPMDAGSTRLRMRYGVWPRTRLVFRWQLHSQQQLHHQHRTTAVPWQYRPRAGQRNMCVVSQTISMLECVLGRYWNIQNRSYASCLQRGRLLYSEPLPMTAHTQKTYAEQRDDGHDSKQNVTDHDEAEDDHALRKKGGFIPMDASSSSSSSSGPSMRTRPDVPLCDHKAQANELDGEDALLDSPFLFDATHLFLIN